MRRYLLIIIVSLSHVILGQTYVFQNFDNSVASGFWPSNNFYYTQGSAIAKMDLSDYTNDKKEGSASLKVNYLVGAGDGWGGYNKRTSQNPLPIAYNFSGGTRISFWYKVLTPVQISQAGSTFIEFAFSDFINGGENRIFREVPVNLSDHTGTWKQITLDMVIKNGGDKTKEWAYQLQDGTREFSWANVNGFSVALVYVTAGNSTNTPTAQGTLLIDNISVDKRPIYSINISDLTGGSQDLTFGLDPSATDGVDTALGEYVIPPMPPAGSFDVRFVLPGNIDNSLTDVRNGSNTSFTTKEHIIQYQVGTGTTIKLTWNLPVGVHGRLQDRVLGTIIDVPMSGSGSYTVTNPKVITSLKMTINYMLGSLPVPVLKTPATNSVDQLLNPTLTWYKSQYADKYKLQVSKDANFTNIVLVDSTLTDTTKQITNLEAVTKYYWRVRSKNSLSANPISSYSSANNFTTELIAPAKPTLLFPGNNAVNIPLKPKLLWSKSKYASGYNIEFQGGWTGRIGTTLDTTSQFNFLKPGSQHTWKIQANNSKGVSGFTDLFTFTTVPTDWNLALHIQDKFLLLGQATNANDQINSIYGEEALPPVPPSGVLDARLILPGNEASLGDYRNSNEEKTIWILSFQPSATGYPITIKWNRVPSPEGTLYIKDRIDGSIINIDMNGQDSVKITNQAITSLQIEYTKQITVNTSLYSGWNMVSVPVTALSMKGTDLFSSGNSQIFGFNDGYTIETNLVLGKGYWVRYPSGKTEGLKGIPSKTNKITLNAGWNMIGVYDKEVQTNQITSSPSNIINSSYFEFNNGYLIASTLKPGKGYWARTSQAGELTLPYTVSKTSSQIVNVIENDWKRVIIQDAGLKEATLYLSNKSREGNKLDLPPTPPNGIFDVRWSTNKLVESQNGVHEIVLSSAEYPVTIKVEACDLWIKDKINGLMVNQLVKKGESLTIANETIERLEVKAVDIPTEFELYQNYPNPFNPTTKIKFSIPQTGLAKLSIFNTIGEQVDELLNKELEAGYHEVEWNASSLSSGVYLVRILFGPNQIVRKIVLMK